MDSWWLIAVAAGLLVFLLWLAITRRTMVFPWLEAGRRGEAQAPVPEARSRIAYLVFVPGQLCCAPAQAQASRHYAPGSAPALPLPGCTRRRCTCFYDKRLERRIGPRRLVEDRRQAVRYEPHRSDRRRRKGRRAEDDIWAEDTES